MADRKKWQRFEAEKRKLAEKGLTYAEYEREVKKTAAQVWAVNARLAAFPGKNRRETERRWEFDP